jgi:hypothetical protein
METEHEEKGTHDEWQNLVKSDRLRRLYDPKAWRMVFHEDLGSD